MSCKCVDDAKYALQQIAELNETDLPSSDLSEGLKQPSKSCPFLFLYPEMAIRTILLLGCW